MTRESIAFRADAVLFVLQVSCFDSGLYRRVSTLGTFAGGHGVSHGSGIAKIAAPKELRLG